MTYPDGRHTEQQPLDRPQFEIPIPHQRTTSGWLSPQESGADRPPPADERRVPPPGRHTYGGVTHHPQHSGWQPPPATGPQQPAGWEQPPPADWQQTSPAAWQQSRRPPWQEPTAAQPGWPGPDRAAEPPPVVRPEPAEETGPELPPLLRGRIVDRLISINASHAGHAADNIRTKDDLCEHALALFSADPADRSHTISTATRLSLSDSDNASMLDVLTALTRVVEQKLAEAGEQGRPWDPRTPLTGLVNRSEELRRPMLYVGVGISTLDTPEQPWRQMKNSIDRHTGLHLRGQGYVHLDDGTIAHFVRAAQIGGQTGQHQITANQTLHTQYRVRRDDTMLAHANQRTFMIWEQLKRLHKLLATATTHR